MQKDNFVLASQTSVKRAAVAWLMEHAASIIAVLIYRVSPLVFWNVFLHVPVVLLCANGEFEVLFGDRVPLLFLTLAIAQRSKRALRLTL